MVIFWLVLASLVFYSSEEDEIKANEQWVSFNLNSNFPFITKVVWLESETMILSATLRRSRNDHAHTHSPFYWAGKVAKPSCNPGSHWLSGSLWCPLDYDLYKYRYKVWFYLTQGTLSSSYHPPCGCTQPCVHHKLQLGVMKTDVRLKS